jgi:hypothetical protein
MTYSIERDNDGKFAICVLDENRDGSFRKTVVSDFIFGTFKILCNGKTVGEVSVTNSGTYLSLAQPDTYLAYTFGCVYPTIHTTACDLLTFKEIV